MCRWSVWRWAQVHLWCESVHWPWRHQLWPSVKVLRSPPEKRGQRQQCGPMLGRELGQAQGHNIWISILKVNLELAASSLAAAPSASDLWPAFKMLLLLLPERPLTVLKRSICQHLARSAHSWICLLEGRKDVNWSRSRIYWHRRAKRKWRRGTL